MRGDDEPDVYVEEHIREALAKDDRVNELELDVHIVGRKVVVSGTVANEDRQSAVTDVVRGVCPEHEVVNQTSVLSVSASPSEERIR